MLGRSIITNPSVWQGCYTYPARKYSDGRFELLPSVDPNYGISNEAIFVTAVTVPAILIFIVVGIVWSCVASRNVKNRDFP
jgi:heme/copper-type cytochrome/quinol oxidase subunit 2